MNGYDDKQPTNGLADTLPRWASISELSTLLDVSRNMISTAVKRAWINGELWVKKEKAEGGNTLYLIDTQHEMYLPHQKRWEQTKALRAELLGETATAWPQSTHSLFPPLSSEEASFSPPTRVPLPWHEQQDSAGVLQRWSRFRQWLYAHEIQVFQNLLAEEGQKKPWEWRWGELHGEGFASDEEAIIAALQSRFDAQAEREKREEQEDETFFRMLEQQENQKPQPWCSWFRRND